ncbi:Mating type protein [Penicillium odoratum]|uniref:Mating type protein n=1 Tax=Penicillium odoratum TaxID=1167516 RepID=UPI002548C59D|nr:Mating type protein [Penicillium odoratum]KAJ5772133.1 Mating type protein [Penicillium odoratum]
MPTVFCAKWPATVVLLYAYLTTIPFWRAVRILSIWNESQQTMEQFARDVIGGIPFQFFCRPLFIPDGPRFVILEGRFEVDLYPDSNKQEQIMPNELHQYVEAWGPAGWPTQRPPKRTKNLNGFMSFRTYLAPLFPKIPQKTKSPLIGYMWTCDKFKPQWSLLSMAYSKLREHFELSDQSLSYFIRLTKQLFNFPRPQAYMDHVGWTINEVAGSETFSLSQITPRITFALPNEAVTLYQIIDFCTTIPGYIGSQKRDSMWPVSLKDKTDLMAIQHGGESIDPLYWLLSDEGALMNGPYEEFTLEDLYDNPDEDMDPIEDLVYTTDFELRMAEEKSERENRTVEEIARGFPYLTAWEPWTSIPATSPPLL